MALERLIVCAASRCRKTGKIVLGIRHWDELMYSFLTEEELEVFDDEQGFIDNRRVFVDRNEAWKIAEAANQIKFRCGGDTADGGTLYSENLY